MEDIEKDLGPLIDNYIKKYEESNPKTEEWSNENENFKYTFNQLVENVIRPEMYEFYQFLDNKGFKSSIFHECGHQAGSITGLISLSFSYKESSNEFAPAILPALKVGIKLPGRKISISESKFDPSGFGCTTLEGTYDIDEITRSFVKEKLSKFFKTLFTTE
jgi:hypothetical protein